MESAPLGGVSICTVLQKGNLAVDIKFCRYGILLNPEISLLCIDAKENFEQIHKTYKGTLFTKTKSWKR